MLIIHLSLGPYPSLVYLYISRSVLHILLLLIERSVWVPPIKFCGQFCKKGALLKLKNHETVWNNKFSTRKNHNLHGATHPNKNQYIILHPLFMRKYIVHLTYASSLSQSCEPYICRVTRYLLLENMPLQHNPKNMEITKLPLF